MKVAADLGVPRPCRWGTLKGKGKRRQAMTARRSAPATRTILRSLTMTLVLLLGTLPLVGLPIAADQTAAPSPLGRGVETLSVTVVMNATAPLAASNQLLRVVVQATSSLGTSADMFLNETLPGGASGESFVLTLSDSGTLPDLVAADLNYTAHLLFVDDRGSDGAFSDNSSPTATMDLRQGGDVTFDADIDSDGTGAQLQLPVDITPPLVTALTYPAYTNGSLPVNVTVTDAGPLAGVTSVELSIAGKPFEPMDLVPGGRAVSADYSLQVTDFSGVSDGPLTIELLTHDVAGNTGFFDLPNATWADPQPAPILDTTPAMLTLIGDPVPSFLGASGGGVDLQVSDANLPTNIADFGPDSFFDIFARIDTPLGNTTPLPIEILSLDLVAIPPTADLHVDIPQAATWQNTSNILSVGVRDPSGSSPGLFTSTFRTDTTGPQFDLPFADGMVVTLSITITITIIITGEGGEVISVDTSSMSWSAEGTGPTTTGQSFTGPFLPNGPNRFASQVILTTWPDGPYDLTVTGVDTLGNSGSSTISFIVDNTQPKLALINPSDPLLYLGDDLLLPVRVTEANLNASASFVTLDGSAPIPLQFNGTGGDPRFTLDPSGPGVLEGAINLPLSALTEGTHVWFIHLVDLAGNSLNLTITQIVQYPEPPTPQPTVTDDGSGHLVVTVPDDPNGPAIDHCTIYVDGVQVATFPTPEAANAYDYSGLSDGPHDVTVTCTDERGKESEPSTPTHITVPAKSVDVRAPVWPTSFQVGVPVTMAVEVTNPNTATPVTITVQCVFNDKVVSFQNATLAPAEQVTVGVPWTPKTQGPGTVRMEVVQGGVVIPAGTPLNITVAPEHSGNGGDHGNDDPSSNPLSIITNAPNLLPLLLLLIGVIGMVYGIARRRRKQAPTGNALDKITVDEIERIPSGDGGSATKGRTPTEPTATSAFPGAAVAAGASALPGGGPDVAVGGAMTVERSRGPCDGVREQWEAMRARLAKLGTAAQAAQQRAATAQQQADTSGQHASEARTAANAASEQARDAQQAADTAQQAYAAFCESILKTVRNVSSTPVAGWGGFAGYGAAGTFGVDIHFPDGPTGDAAVTEFLELKKKWKEDLEGYQRKAKSAKEAAAAAKGKADQAEQAAAAKEKSASTDAQAAQSAQQASAKAAADEQSARSKAEAFLNQYRQCISDRLDKLRTSAANAAAKAQTATRDGQAATSPEDAEASAQRAQSAQQEAERAQHELDQLHHDSGDVDGLQDDFSRTRQVVDDTLTRTRAAVGVTGTVVQRRPRQCADGATKSEEYHKRSKKLDDSGEVEISFDSANMRGHYLSLEDAETLSTAFAGGGWAASAVGLATGGAVKVATSLVKAPLKAGSIAISAGVEIARKYNERLGMGDLILRVPILRVDEKWMRDFTCQEGQWCQVNDHKVSEQQSPDVEVIRMADIMFSDVPARTDAALARYRR